MDRGANIQTRCCVVIEVGALAHRVLRRARRGRVVAVFDRSLYVAFGDDWICVGSKSIGSGPLHVLCEEDVAGWFSPGQDVVAADGALRAGDSRLFGLDVSPIWSPKSCSDWTRESLGAGLLAVNDAWRVMPTEEGLAAAGCAQSPPGPTPVLAAAMPGIAALRRSVEAGAGGGAPVSDPDELAGLLGLGPGLTPSGDDFLAGALLALASLGLSDLRDTLWDRLRAQLDRTHDISAAHLRSAAAGYAASALHEAIDATIGGRIDRVAPALVALSAIGHSSGRDAFAGALVVLRAVNGCAARGGGSMQTSAVAA